MPRPKKPVPSYRFHKFSGQAVVTLPLADGRRRDVLLGRYDTPESKAEYLRVIKEWQATGGNNPAPRPPGTPSGLTVNELLVAYLRHADAYYVDRSGEPTKEARCVRDALRPVKQLYGHTPAAEFRPLALKAVRKAMVDAGLARTVCNARVNRIRRAFKWAASEELIPFLAYQSLTTVRGFVRGRGEARETEPVGSADPSDVAATLPFLPPALAAMVRLQSLTGMRPGEVVRLRLNELDRSGPVWVDRPRDHKTAYRGKERAVCIGPRAQELLVPWLQKAGGGYVFSPARQREERLARLRSSRRSKVQPSQACRKAANPSKLPGERYTTESYGQSVAKGVQKANRGRGRVPDGLVGPPLPPVSHWHPNQLRHSFATEVRKRFGLEGAGASLGHSKMSVTEVYAERDHGLALRVAAELG